MEGRKKTKVKQEVTEPKRLLLLAVWGMEHLNTSYQGGCQHLNAICWYNRIVSILRNSCKPLNFIVAVLSATVRGVNTNKGLLDIILE